MIHDMKLSVWAKKHGICYKTAWRWWRTGTLPVAAQQLATGTILVTEKEAVHETGSEPVILYARVSSSDQSKDLDRQLARLVEYATSRGYPVKGAVKEVGSGLNGKRLKLLSGSFRKYGDAPRASSRPARKARGGRILEQSM
jgi:putative resolvase